MILEKKKMLHKKEIVWVAKIIIFSLIVSCTTKRHYDEIVEIDRNNCSSFHQNGKGYTDGGIAATVHGEVRMCYNNEVVSNAKVLFISGKDTVENLITDEKGKFSKQISADGFWGTIIIDRFGSSMTINDVKIDGNFKNYYLDIKLPRQPVYWNESVPKKDQKKMRKEVENND